MTSEQLFENLKKVRANINTYSSKKVRLIAVSKKFPIEHINSLIDRGHLEFGENYLQEALEKIKKINKFLNSYHMFFQCQEREYVHQ